MFKDKALPEELHEAEDAARALFANDPATHGFKVDPEFARMSKRERKRYIKRVHKELNAELAVVQKEAATAREQAREAQRAQKATAAEIEKRLRERSAASKKRGVEAKKRRAKASNTADALGYNMMYANGICEVEEGFFSETLEFDDITYQSAREVDQKSILATLCDVYNYFPPEVSVQIGVVNMPLRDDEVRSRTFYDADAQANEVLREDAETMNEVLAEKLSQGVSNIRRRRFLTIGTWAADAEEAYRRLSRVNTDLAASFEQSRCPLRALTGEERLEVMNMLLRPDRKFDFSYDDITCYGPDSTKDAIAPMAIDFKPDGSNSYFKMDGKYCQVLVMRKFDSPLDDSVIAKIVDMQLPLEVTWHIKPYDKNTAINLVKVRRAWIDKEIIDEQKKAVQQGYDYSILPSEVRYSRDETDDLLQKLQGQQQNLFDFLRPRLHLGGHGRGARRADAPDHGRRRLLGRPYGAARVPPAPGAAVHPAARHEPHRDLEALHDHRDLHLRALRHPGARPARWQLVLPEPPVQQPRLRQPRPTRLPRRLHLGQDRIGQVLLREERDRGHPAVQAQRPGDHLRPRRRVPPARRARPGRVRHLRRRP